MRRSSAAATSSAVAGAARRFARARWPSTASVAFSARRASPSAWRTRSSVASSDSGRHVTVLGLQLPLGAQDNRRERFGPKRLEHEHAQARQQRRVQLERRILGRGADQRDDAGLDGRQERILLRAVEAMDLVAEQDRAASFDLAALLRFANDLAHARHAFGHGAERHELLVGVAGEQARERRLAAAGRAPQHHARDRALLDRFAQRLAGAEQLLVAEEIVEGVGPQPMGERRCRPSPAASAAGKELELVGNVPGHNAAFYWLPAA